MKNFKFLLIIVVSVFFSCSTENESSMTNQNSIENSLVFKKIGYNQEDIGQRPVVISGNTGNKFIVVSWDEWGRKRKNCAGWGLCNAEWFHCTDAEGNPVDCFKFPPNGYETFLQVDDLTSQYYIEILLAEETDIPKEELALNIDEDIVLNISSAIGTDLKFNSGVYLFDSNLGDYGGFKIYLSKLNN